MKKNSKNLAGFKKMLTFANEIRNGFVASILHSLH